MFKMQYRTKQFDYSDWNDWIDLPETLIFTDIYLPHYFEFRSVAVHEPRFVF